MSSLALRAGGSGVGAAFLAGTKDGDVFEMQYDGAAVRGPQLPACLIPICPWWRDDLGARLVAQ